MRRRPRTRCFQYHSILSVPTVMRHSVLSTRQLFGLYNSRNFLTFKHSLPQFIFAGKNSRLHLFHLWEYSGFIAYKWNGSGWATDLYGRYTIYGDELRPRQAGLVTLHTNGVRLALINQECSMIEEVFTGLWTRVIILTFLLFTPTNTVSYKKSNQIGKFDFVNREILIFSPSRFLSII